MPMNRFLCGCLCLLGSLATNTVTGQHFLDVQDEAQIDHVTSHTAFLGGGGAFLDYDNDGDEDIYLIGGAEVDRLYENNGDGTFSERTAEAGLFSTSFYYTTGVTAGDIDNDGDTDIFVTTWFGDLFAKNLLFRNNGNGTFSDIWIQLEDADQVLSMGAVLIDFDLDGLLDIYVINYVEDAQFTYDENNQVIGFEHICYGNRFYHNLGGGQFSEITESVGLHDTGCALAVAATDYDLDGDLDIYLANDFGEFIQPNRLFRNNYPVPSFTEVGAETGADIGMYGMGIAVGDVDMDLDLDYYVTNFGRNVMLRNDGGTFTDVTNQTGTADTWDIQDSLLTVGWGTALLDIDNDSDLDLYVANGYVPSPNFIDARIFIQDRLFRNEGDWNFTEVGADYGIDNVFTTRGFTYADYDNDGDLDMLAIVMNVPLNEGTWQTKLYNNQVGNELNWLQVSLEGVDANRSAFGSRIYVYAGELALMHELAGGASHASQLSSRAHFGLGETASIDSLAVVWPGGFRRQVLYDLSVNQHLTIIEDTTIVIDTVQIVNTTSELRSPVPIQVSPNPSSGRLRLEALDAGQPVLRSLQIRDAMGKMMPGTAMIAGSHSTLPIELDLSSFPPGLYLLRITLADGTIWQERVVLH